MSQRMGRYCKVYPASRLREFPQWSEKVPPMRLKMKDEGGGEKSAGEREYYYVQDDYTVTANIFFGENIAFENVTEEWKEFCRNHLQFEVPPRYIPD
jgi:hypothetical protein